MSCQRSVKSPHPGGRTYKDLFSLHVLGNTTAVCDLEFNISASPGVFLGHWRGSFRPDLTDINNTVVDVGVAKNGSYEWTLEFQCADNATAAARAGTLPWGGAPDARYLLPGRADHPRTPRWTCARVPHETCCTLTSAGAGRGHLRGGRLLKVKCAPAPPP